MNYKLESFPRGNEENARLPITKFRRLSLGFLLIVATVYVFLAIIGGIRMYSPVPVLDMWNGYLDFFIRAQEGDLTIWWSQHNEHRIFLSRILFWLDLYFFKGLSIFLIFFNYLLGGLIYFCFFNILKKALPDPEDRFLRNSLSLFILALTFSWTQFENYIWAFQSQFFLAYLLPLMGFYSLYLSSNREKNSRFLFLFAFLAGTAALGSMANGVLALPLMTILALFLKLDWKKILFLGSFSALFLFSFFYNNIPVPYHASLGDSFLHHPIGVIKFVLLFFGSPFFYISGPVKFVGAIAGVFFISACFYFLYCFAKKKNSSSLQLVLFAFISYISITVIGIAGSRLGISQPTDSRYLTPTIMAWIALLILYILNAQITTRHRVIPILILVLIFLFPWQIRTVTLNLHAFERELAVLALKMQIKDPKQIFCVYPHLRVLEIAKRASENNLSIFGTQRFQRVSLLGQIDSGCSSYAPCLGYFDESTFLEDDPSYVKIKGWLYEPHSRTAPFLIHVLNQDNQIIGYALTGQPRKDLKKAIHFRAYHSGFSGYMLAEYAGKEVILKGIMPDCQLVAKAKELPLENTY
jgi:hypothetical protein